MKRVLGIAIWSALAILAATALATIALHRGELISAMWFVLAAGCSYLVAYRMYSAFIAAKLLALDNTRATPAERRDDGRDFVPTNKWVLFGHHFAAIAGPGPLVGPTLAAQFGYLAGHFVAHRWCGLCRLCARFHYFILLHSPRRKTLGEMAREEVSKRGGFIAQFAVLAIMIIFLGVVALVIVNALKSSPWATFTLAITIPIALLLGVYLRFLRPGRVLEASLVGVALVLFGVVAGQWVANSPSWSHAFTLTGVALAFAIIIYGLLLPLCLSGFCSLRVTISAPSSKLAQYFRWPQESCSCVRMCLCRRSLDLLMAMAPFLPEKFSRFVSSPLRAARSAGSTP